MPELRTIQSIFIPLGKGNLGGGTIVHAEDFTFPTVKYALIECIEHKYKFNPAGIKTVREHRIGRFEYRDGMWNETSSTVFSTKQAAKKAYKGIIDCLGLDEHYAADYNSNR